MSTDEFMVNYGIDLGTSNCLVAKLTKQTDNRFSLECLTDENGNVSFPSVLFFQSETKYKVGHKALKYLSEKPESTIELVKVRLGSTDFIDICTEESNLKKSPQEISAFLLNHINTLYDNAIKSAVITVPAFFDQSQKDATMQAGIIADITPEFLIEEPTAAIMYHIFTEYQEKGLDLFDGKPEKKILVFDFGGGTLDLSLIHITLQDRTVMPKVIAIGGDTELGGNMIDFVFVKVILKILKSKYENDKFILDVCIAFDDYYQNYIERKQLSFSGKADKEVINFIFRLKHNLEKIKIRLSSVEKAIIEFEREYNPIEISRQQFERHVLMSDDLNIRERVESALNQISKKRERISGVLLIGGSSQIPFLKDIITDTLVDMGITKERIMLSNDSSQAVAKGAAIQSAISHGIPVPPFMLNKCESIVARDIQIEHAGNSNLLVAAGTEYPFKEKKEFNLKVGHALSEAISLRLNEKVSIPGKPDEKREICNFTFYLPIYYTNDDIVVFMNIDEAGLYQIEAIHKNTGEVVEFEPHKRFSLTDSQLKEAKTRSKKMIEVK